MKLIKVWEQNDFVKQYEEEIYDEAKEAIGENEGDYFDGYTSFTDEDYHEVIEEHWDGFVRLYAEQIDILLDDDHK